ncbi:MAG: hypothetical protein Q9220_005765 [cf. Caloplaca sp. 1 TL-2023]
MKALLLHSHSSGPNPFKACIILENLELPYELKLWRLGSGERGVRSEEFLQINPNGRVPALEDPNTGVVSWESAAVINYLLRVYDKSNLLHPSPEAENGQAIVDFDKWTSFLVTTMGPMLGQRNWYVNFNATDNEDARRRYGEQSLRCFDVLEQQLAKSGGKNVLPTGFSAVDAHFWPWCRQYKFAQLDISPYKHFQKWFAEIEARPEIKVIDAKIAACTEGQEKGFKVH